MATCSIIILLVLVNHNCYYRPADDIFDSNGFLVRIVHPNFLAEVTCICCRICDAQCGLGIVIRQRVGVRVSLVPRLFPLPREPGDEARVRVWVRTIGLILLWVGLVGRGSLQILYALIARWNQVRSRSCIDYIIRLLSVHGAASHPCGRLYSLKPYSLALSQVFNVTAL